MSSIQPGRSFLGVQGVVGHYHDADSSHVEHAPDVGIEGLRLEKSARFTQARAVGGQAKSFEDGDNASRGFGYRSVFDKERAPNRVGLLRFGKREILLGLGV